jgi:glycerophosphoryl diester phosphodiesterase
MPKIKNSFDFVDPKRPTIFAHRGSSAYAPENTLAAFKLAIDQYADGIELDVKLSADGYVMVMHDDTVDRTTNGTGVVKSLTLPELKKLEAGSKFSPLFKSEKIPTLAEVFETVGQKTFINVELTNYSSPVDDLPDKVISLVMKYSLETSVMLSSFNMIGLIRARNLLPKIPMGLLTFPGYAQITLRSGLVRFGPLLALHTAHSDVTPNLIQTAHQAKCRIHAYTVNQPDIMRQLFTAGVDGIFTDDPLLAHKVLAENLNIHDTLRLA